MLKSELKLLRQEYEENKDKHILSWMKFIKYFKLGRQGIVGLMCLKKNNNIKCVFKFSQNMDYIIDQESIVLNSLSDISDKCPCFCKFIGTIDHTIDTQLFDQVCDDSDDSDYNENDKIKNIKNPFINQNDSKVKQKIMLFEYIDNSVSLSTYIRSSKAEDRVIFSVIKNILLSLIIAQKHKKLCHYDLHSNNILLKRCDDNIVFRYTFDDNEYEVPSFGFFPVIIDFGYSYIQDHEDCPLWAPLTQTHAGYTCDRFDKWADFRLFLISFSSELKEVNYSINNRKFRNIVKKIFKDFNVDWRNGWTKSSVVSRSIGDEIMDKIEHVNTITTSELISDNLPEVYDILQTLILTPIGKTESNYSFRRNFKNFISEWKKVDSQLKTRSSKLYMFKTLIDTVRYVRHAVFNEDTQEQVYADFSSLMIEKIDKFAKYIRLNSIDFKLILTSLIQLTLAMENMMDQYMTLITEQMDLESSTITYSQFEIIDMISKNIELDYNIIPSTTIFVNFVN